ncbi:hypothetical protein GMMP1_10060 [Candidatus Magnetomoraceae bacterium gMMP-1]
MNILKKVENLFFFHKHPVKARIDVEIVALIYAMGMHSIHIRIGITTAFC